MRGCLLVLPHDCWCSLQVLGWATPLTWPVFVCVLLHACGLVGVGEKASQVSLHYWVICQSQCAFSSSLWPLNSFPPSIPPLDSPLSLPPPDISAGNEQGRGRPTSDLDLSKMDWKHEEEEGPGPDLDLWLACIFMRHHRLKTLLGLKGADVRLVCRAQQVHS